MEIAVIIMNDDETQFKRRVDKYEFENKTVKCQPLSEECNMGKIASFLG